MIANEWLMQATRLAIYENMRLLVFGPCKPRTATKRFYVLVVYQMGLMVGLHDSGIVMEL
jgi:hypothetical protein